MKSIVNFPHSLTQMAWLIARHRPILQYGWRLRPRMIQQLAAVLGVPQPTQPRKLSDSKLLTAHVVLMEGLGWLARQADGDVTRLVVTAQHDAWLALPSAEQWAALTPLLMLPDRIAWYRRAAVESPLDAAPDAWERAAQVWKAEIGLDESYRLYVAQQVARGQALCEAWATRPYGTLVTRDEAWWLAIAPHCPPALLTETLVVGERVSNSLRRLTPTTLSAALAAGMTAADLISLIETITTTQVTAEQGETLTAWCRAARAYQLAPVNLLTVQAPAQLSELRQRRSLAKHVVRQLSPVAATVNAAIAAPLERYAAAQGVGMVQPGAGVGQGAKQAISERSAEAAWLALRLLGQLNRTFGLGETALLGASNELSELISAEAAERLAARSKQLAATIQYESEREAVRTARLLAEDQAAEAAAGRSAGEQWLPLIEQALAQSAALRIAYQGRKDDAPRERLIVPVALQGAEDDFYAPTLYLRAWCTTAEGERQFRLDRISEMQLSTEPLSSTIDSNKVQLGLENVD